MSKERPPYLPELPTPWPRPPVYVPGSVEVATTASGAVLWDANATPPSPGSEPPTAPERPVAPEQRRRVELSGNIGREPVFGRTPKGQPKVEFMLAVHPDPETTTWHKVVAFEKLAPKLQGVIHRGTAVEVIGYVHQKQRTTKAGTVEPYEEIYATVVRPVPKPHPPPPTS